MAEYIEREALMRRIKEIHCTECDSYHGVRCRACWVDDTLDYIDSEPAADVEPVKRGRWLPQILNGTRIWDCSECKTIGSPEWKRCPVCEAKMDEEAQQ